MGRSSHGLASERQDLAHLVVLHPVRVIVQRDDIQPPRSFELDHPRHGRVQDRRRLSAQTKECSSIERRYWIVLASVGTSAPRPGFLLGGGGLHVGPLRWLERTKKLKAALQRSCA